MGNSATVDAGQQHLQALEHANRVRLARAAMKRQVAAGELTASEVILTCPWHAQSMSISHLLMSQKRWGRARCRRLLLTIGVPENKSIGSLTERQRRALAAVLTTMGAKASAASRAAQPAAGRVAPAPTPSRVAREGVLSAA